jgi:hypothetical protein
MGNTCNALDHCRGEATFASPDAVMVAATAPAGNEAWIGHPEGPSASERKSLMRKFLIVTVFALATPAMAHDCPDKVIAAADHLGLNRVESFGATHPTYYLPASLDGSGLLVIDCIEATEVTMTVYSEKPSDRFMAIFGESAHDVAGVSAQDAVASARECQKDGLARKGLKKELVFGDPIEKPDLYVGCRVGVNFTSFSVFQQR